MTQIPSDPGTRPAFLTTHWSVVLRAGRSETTRAREALEKLCRTYWPPLYAYIRRRGYLPHDAQDLTQEFFTRLLEGNAVARVDPAKGKFRSFLLASLKHFLADEWDKARAEKRGGGRIISLDAVDAESSYLQEPVDARSPEKVFDHRWALTLLEDVYQRLHQEHADAGKGELFAALRFCLMGERSAIPYGELAANLNLSESALKVAVHRLRQRYRAVLHEVIADTVATPEEVEEELRHLLRTLAG